MILCNRYVFQSHVWLIDLIGQLSCSLEDSGLITYGVFLLHLIWGNTHEYGVLGDSESIIFVLIFVTFYWGNTLGVLIVLVT